MLFYPGEGQQEKQKEKAGGTQRLRWRVEVEGDWGHGALLGPTQAGDSLGNVVLYGSREYGRERQLRVNGSHLVFSV